DFYESYLGRDFKKVQQKLVSSREVNLAGLRVGIVEVNTAWRATGAPDGDRGRLLGASDLVEINLRLIGDCDIRLVVMHHPPSWMAPFEQRSLENVLEGVGSVVLTGHEHYADPRLHFTVSGVAAYVRAGCLF